METHTTFVAWYPWMERLYEYMLMVCSLLKNFEKYRFLGPRGRELILLQQYRSIRFTICPIIIFGTNSMILYMVLSWDWWGLKWGVLVWASISKQHAWLPGKQFPREYKEWGGPEMPRTTKIWFSFPLLLINFFTCVALARYPCLKSFRC